MPAEPRIDFFLAQQSDPVQPGGDYWDRPLPVSPTALAGPGDHSEPEATANHITYGDYFTAVATFLFRDENAVVKGAIVNAHKQHPGAIETIVVYLVKHGEFYHPAKIAVRARRAVATFVLNVAVSAVGRATIEGEYRLLGQLASQVSEAATPLVYGFGRIPVPGKQDLPMFLGQWFEDFHEFHLTRTAQAPPQSDAAQRREALSIVVWDPGQGPVCLTRQQTAALYHEIAKTLTRYYEPLTFAQIFPWHHAAGDFIVNPAGRQLAVRLITVRRYAPVFDVPVDAYEASDAISGGPPSLQLVFEALLVFLLNLLVRLRLDRLDGVGDAVWAEKAALTNGLAGFWEALAEKPIPDQLPLPLAEAFRLYTAELAESDLYDLTWTMVRNQNPGPAELDVVRQNLPNHIARLWHLLRPDSRSDSEAPPHV